MATAGWLAPYKTAGAKPLTRRRRASFLPRDSRSSAVTVISFLILLTPNFYLYLPRGARTRACRVETRLDACPQENFETSTCRDESRHSTHECVRYAAGKYRWKKYSRDS